MRLLIISDMEHHYQNDGTLVGHGASLRELSRLSSLFDEVVHIGCLWEGEGSNLMLPYTADNVTFVPLPPSGGHRPIDKLSILWNIPRYILTMMREIPKADVIHVRSPANIPLLAMILLSFYRHPKKRWIKYAGNWKPSYRDARSSVFQRWWLTKNFPRAKVTVNGEWPEDPDHINFFLNPCLTDEELSESRDIERHLEQPVRMLFIGRLDEKKGIGRAITICSELHKKGYQVELDVAGDSKTREQYENLAIELDVEDRVHFHGWVLRHELNDFYRQSHFILLPSVASEGWPKVLSEAMAYGVVPIASDISSIPTYLKKYETGRAISIDAVEKYVTTIEEYINNQDMWHQESKNGQKAAYYFSYEYYLKAVKELLDL